MNKLKLLVLIIAAAVGLMVFPFSIQAQQITNGVITVGETSYTMDNFTYYIDVAPFIENNRIYVPIRYLGNMLSLAGDGVIWSN